MGALALQSTSADLPVDKPTCLLGSGFSVVLQMPTGSGKTHRAGQAIREAVNRGFRAVYVCPTRALANELYARWGTEWPDVRIGVFTGDFGGELEYPVPFKLAQVLVMTAERFDVCTRQWRHHWDWLPKVDMVVVDELHLLADPHRGPRLEGAVVRMRTLNPFVRVVGLSATLGNASELADWLDGACFVSRHRPIETVWRTVTFSRADEKPQRLLDALEPVLMSSGMSLVFVQSKRRAENLAHFLRAAGVAADHHHGGLTLEERRSVEHRFRSKQLHVLVATATLEVGLNMPVRQVVLYDLQQFDGTDFRPLSVISAWQRAGRAGRPGLDDKAEVVLFRARWERDQRYELGRFEPI
jgi:helicase